MLRVVTLNCQKAFQPDFKPYFEQIMKERRYHFLLLQEVDLKTLEIIQPLYKEHGYIRLGAFSPKSNTELYTCILYKSEFEFLRSDFITFTPIVFQEITETGSIAGVFAVPRNLRKIIGKRKILLIATHIHASYHILARRKELLQVKNQALHLDPTNDCLKIIAGDLNNLFAGEQMINDNAMKPEFTNVCDFPDYTYDSKYIEPKYSEAVYSRLFFRLGKRYRLKLDHIYMDTESANTLHYQTNVVKVTASDHRPVELTITLKETRFKKWRAKRAEKKKRVVNSEV